MTSYVVVSSFLNLLCTPNSLLAQNSQALYEEEHAGRFDSYCAYHVAGDVPNTFWYVAIETHKTSTNILCFRSSNAVTDTGDCNGNKVVWYNYQDGLSNVLVDQRFMSFYAFGANPNGDLSCVRYISLLSPQFCYVLLTMISCRFVENNAWVHELDFVTGNPDDRWFDIPSPPSGSKCIL
jgi:hypothetical protein